MNPVRKFFVQTRLVDSKGKPSSTFFNLTALNTVDAHCRARAMFSDRARILNISIQETFDPGFMGTYTNNDRL